MIVVLSGNPKHRYSMYAGLLETAGNFDSGKSL
jgi:hypothetical protein